MKQLFKNIWQSPKSSAAAIAMAVVMVLLIKGIITVDQIAVLGTGLGVFYGLFKKDQ